MGTAPSSCPILLPFRGNFFVFSSGVFEVLENDLFQDNFMMAFHSFGGVNDQCGVTLWAVQQTGMLLLLSCDSGMTACLGKAQVEGFKCVLGRRGRPGDAKATGRGHTRAKMALIAVYGTLLLEERR